MPFSPSEHTRRAFIRQAAQACLGVSLGAGLSRPTLAAASPDAASPDEASLDAAPSDRPRPAIIYIYLDGGMSQIDTFDTKPGRPEQGPVQTVQTSVSGLGVSEHLPKLARRMHDFSLIRSMVTIQGDHIPARDFLHTSYVREADERRPSLAAWSALAFRDPARLLNGAAVIDPYVQHPFAGCLDPRCAPLAIADPAVGLRNSNRNPHLSEHDFAAAFQLSQDLAKPFRQRWRQRNIGEYAQLYELAARVMDSRELAAFDISKEPGALRQRYGDDRFGQGCLLARRLVEHGFHFIEVTFPGWDTHVDHFAKSRELARTLDNSLAALADDLRDRGLWDSTLIAVATEFGRTPGIEAFRKGRDHHVKAFCCLLGGGRARGGVVYGKTDERANEVIADPVEIPDFNATIAHALGIPADLQAELPGHQEPIRPTAHGRCVQDLIV